MKVHLKVKIKSLAAEARIIRKEELRRAWGDERASLYAHRIGIVRSAARHALLAYGFMRGRPLERIEPSRRTEPDWKEVQRLIERYAGRSAAAEFERWRQPPQTSAA